MDGSTTPEAAHSALTLAAQARQSAHGPRPVPGWLPPTAAVLCAAGFAGFALLSAHPAQKAYLVVGIVALALFAVLVALAIRQGGVAPLPSGSAGQRTRRQLLMLIPLPVGAVAAVFYGFAGFAAVLGVGFGVVAWAQLARYGKGERP
jgi:hypothetical protein